jgi:hypothetical protein
MAAQSGRLARTVAPLRWTSRTTFGGASVGVGGAGGSVGCAAGIGNRTKVGSADACVW